MRLAEAARQLGTNEDDARSTRCQQPNGPATAGSAISGRADPESLYAVLDAGPTAHLG